MLTAQRVARIKPSPSTAAAQRVRELKDRGHRILDLTVGEPDFDTPEHVKRAAVDAITRGETKYTPVNGTPRLRKAIADKLARRHGLTFEPERITVGGGAKQVIYLAFAATVDSGDEVIVPTPYWVSYPDMVLANDGTPVIVECAEEDGFKLTPERLRAAITPQTRWLILNTPGNPAGAAYDGAELRALADVLLDHPQIWVLTDDMYEHLLYDGLEFATIAQVEPRLQARTLTMNGVSKAYCMTGWRIGYAAGPVELDRKSVV